MFICECVDALLFAVVVYNRKSHESFNLKGIKLVTMSALAFSIWAQHILSVVVV